MKTTTITRHNLKDGMAIMRGNDVFYIVECVHNNDDSTLLAGNYSSFYDYPGASIILYDSDRVKVVIE